MTVTSGAISLFRKFISLIIALCRRAICWRKKHRRNSGTLLPVYDKMTRMASDYPQQQQQQQKHLVSTPSSSPVFGTMSTSDAATANFTSSTKQGYNISSCYSYDSYSSTNLGHHNQASQGNYHANANPAFVTNTPINFSPIIHPASSLPASSSVPPNVHSGDNPQSLGPTACSPVPHEKDGDEEIDFFKDMAPTIKKPRKVYVSKLQTNEPAVTNHFTPSRQTINSRFSVDPSASFEVSPELGILDDNFSRESSWEDETYAADELGMSVEDTLSVARVNERMRRLAEHKRIKIEKEQRKVKSSKSNFIATKLS